MSDHVFLVYKVGDAKNGILDGMPVCYIDPDNYPNVSDYQSTFSDHMKMVFLTVKLPKSRLSKIKEQLIDGESKRRSKIKFKKLGLEIGNANLENQLRSNNKVEIIDGTGIEDSILFDQLDGKAAIDFNAISSGNFTIGTAADYATIVLFATDLANLTGNLTGTVITDVTETASSLINVNLTSFILKITSDFKIVTSNFNGILFDLTMEGPGELCIEKLNIVNGFDLTSNIGNFSINNINTSSTIRINDNIMDGANEFGRYGIFIFDNTPTLYVYNNICYDYQVAPVFVIAGSSQNIYENNTLYNNSRGFRFNNNAGKVQNNSCFDNSVSDFENVGSATGNNNASSDTSADDGNWNSGSNNQISLVAAEEFVSLIDTEDDFLLPIAGGNLNGNGITPSIPGHTSYLNSVALLINSIDIAAKGLVRDGISLIDEDGIAIGFSKPSYGYSTTIDFPWDIQALDNGKYETFDHGTLYDKRKCSCLIYLTESEMDSLNSFLSEDNSAISKGRAYDVTLRMNTNSGFFPFGPDKGDVGDFDVAIKVKVHGRVGDEPFRFFAVELEIHNVGAWPSYVLPTAKHEGNFTFGTVTECRFPPAWFKPKNRYATFLTIDQGSSSNWIDRGANGDRFETSFDFACDNSKASRVIAYIADSARSNTFTVVPPANAFMFGEDKGDTATYTVRNISNRIKITHSRKTLFTFPIKLSYVSQV